MDPFEFRRINVVKPDDQMIAESDGCHRHRVRQLRPRSMHRPGAGGDEARQRRQASATAPTGSKARAWRFRCMARCRRPSIVRRRDSALARTATITSRSAPPSSATVPRRFIGKSCRACSRARLSRVRVVQSDTDNTGYDTGAFASAGTVVAGNAVRLRGRGSARPDAELRFEKLRRRPRLLPPRARRHLLQ